MDPAIYLRELRMSRYLPFPAGKAIFQQLLRLFIPDLQENRGLNQTCFPDPFNPVTSTPSQAVYDGDGAIP
jgi:hypothetical protein